MDKGLDIAMLRTFLAFHAAVYGNPKALLEPPQADSALPDWPDAALHRLRTRGIEPAWAAADRAQEWLALPGHHLVLLHQSAYPALLRACVAPPSLLFVDGDLGCLSKPQIAVVGSRHATPRGMDIAHGLAHALASSGVLITSGLARGIDGAAHRGALAAGGRTVAVLGCAIDRVYPAQHRELAHDITHNGALISEFPFGAPPLAAHFPRRNRIISGLALGTLVVEAALRSGSLSTALHALDQGREVFAVPGSIQSPLSKGCHALIKQGAKLVEDVGDIIEELRDLGTSLQLQHAMPPANVNAVASEVGDPRILRACGWDPFTLDDVVSRSGLTVQEVSSMLLKLELTRIIQAQGVGSYLRIR